VGFWNLTKAASTAGLIVALGSAAGCSSGSTTPASAKTNRSTSSTIQRRESSTAAAAHASLVASEMSVGNFTVVRAGFDATMLAGLSEQQLGAAWQQMTATLGAFQHASAPIYKSIEGYATYFVPMVFAYGSLEVQVVFNGRGQTAGFFLRPAGFDAST